MSEWRVLLSDLDYGADEEAAVVQVLRSKWLSMGPEVEAFEREFADLLGVKHCLAVANGTAALHLAYLALEIGPGDGVIQPAINFVAAANTAVAVGAAPELADIVSLDEPTIDPADIRQHLTPNTKAVVVMHYGGYLCRMSEISEICRQNHLFLIEDACHAVGARYWNAEGRAPHGQMAGALGDVGCFSFFSNKNLAVGEGGMVVTNRDDLAERLRKLRSHGMTTLTWDRHRGHAASYDVVLNGYNYRMDEVRAALGRVQLAKLVRNNGRRADLVSAYRRGLAELEGWILPFGAYWGDSAYHLMVAVAPGQSTRERCREALRQAGIQTSMHYPCIADFTAFRDLHWQGLSRSREFSARAITLPLYPSLTLEQVDAICAVIGANSDG